jgi:hypothetical protein
MRNLDMQTGLEKLQFTDDPHAVDAAAGERGSIAHARPWLVLVQDSDNDTVSGTDEETEELSNEHMTEAPRFQVLPDDHDATCCDAHDRVQRILEPQEPPLDRVRQQPEYEREKDTLSGQRYYMNYGFAEEIQPGDEVDE